MAKVTGIGGVFFQSKGDPAALAAWYRKHLGMPLSDFGGAVLRAGPRTGPTTAGSPSGISPPATAGGSPRARRRS